MTTWGAASGSAGTSHRDKAVAAAAAWSRAQMNPGASEGRMPEKVSASDRATVTAGLAKDVEIMNQ
jgi:hypothetical protein